MSELILNPDENLWMRGAGVEVIFKALPQGSTRFVGGCVRNAVMGREASDIDLATELTPDAVVSALEAAGIRHIPTGIDHGTVTAIFEKRPYEITSLRRDVKTDGRRAVVAFTTDWAEDAQRRDLTFNALYADYSGRVFDPTGLGLIDLAERRFRFVGNAGARVREDYLRILRYFRFLAWYGEGGTAEAASLAACRDHASGLSTLSAERVWSEIKKLLSAPSPARAVRIMLTQNVLEEILPEASNAEGLERLAALERREGLGADPLLRLMAMASRDPLQIARLVKRLKMSKAETTRLMGWAMDSAALDPHSSERDKRAAIYGAGAQPIMDRARLRAAGEEDPIKAARWLGYSELAERWTPPEFPLTGKDMLKAGAQPGAAMGKKLEALKALWVRSDFTADKAKLLMALSLLK
jgi:poly(A) polymerase